jgi:hypothetical protein
VVGGRDRVIWGREAKRNRDVEGRRTGGLEEWRAGGAWARARAWARKRKRQF